MHPGDFPPTYITITNSETGRVFNVRLVRKGEMYGRQWAIRHEGNEPLLIFHHANADDVQRREPSRTGEYLGPALPAYLATSFMSDTPHGVDLYQTGDSTDITSDNFAELSRWLKAELKNEWSELAPPPPPPSRDLIRSDFILPSNDEVRLTIYMGTAFGYRKIEVKWLEVVRTPYAQYRNAHKVRFLERRKKYAREFVHTTDPKFVVVLGWDHFDPQDGFREMEIEELEGATALVTRFVSYDKAYDDEFEADLDKYLSNNELVTVVADFRDFRADDHDWTAETGLPKDVVISTRSKPVRQYIPTEGMTPSIPLPKSLLFISYHHRSDAVSRKRVERVLGDQVISTSVYPGEIGLTENDATIRRYIKQRIARCDVFTCLIGSDTHTSFWVDWEVYIALTLLRENELTAVVPVILDERLFWEVNRVSKNGEYDNAEALNSILAEKYGRIPLRILDNIVSGACKPILLSEIESDPSVLLNATSFPHRTKTLRRPKKREL